MHLEVIESGVLMTIQDQGRKGYQASGFSVSGCMDQRAFHDANALLNNNLEEAVLEMSYYGGTVRFTGESYFVLTGADMTPRLNGREVATYKVLQVKGGDVLQCGKARNGRFTYLGVAGGFDVPLVLGSKSTYLKCGIGGYHGRKLKSGDQIPIRKETKEILNLYLKQLPPPRYSSSVSIRVVPGPQFSYFTENGIGTFFKEEYVVTEASDRMGYRLEGPFISYYDKVDIISDAIVFGSIQIPAIGMPMILLADRQTTGGYAKIGTVVTSDLPKLVQCMPGAKVRFECITVESAILCCKKEEKSCRQLRKKVGYCRNNEGWMERKVKEWKQRK